ncbi:hypothetical protein [Paludisphaera borealis]|uniref:Uncharacterized protein n=1 Tax=Paludisphaera borealis TaxID=1387353 RepID=A0A1U7CSF7_9BACT|nr:hypothetical protein [Paludisphaera borealis]APW61880.1 hypothetical protein BSF38_03410 [Paludisphaera borealis]
MPNERSTIWNALLGLVLLSLIVSGLIWLGHYLISTFAGLNPNIAAAIVAAFATVTVSVLTVVVGKRLEALTLITKEHRERKIPVYEDFIKFWLKYLFSGKAGDTPLSDEEVIRFLSEYTQRMMVWGSDEVIAAWVKFRYSSMNAEQQSESSKILVDLEQLILAMRRDLGHKNQGFKTGDILRMFVNDVGTASG